MPSTSRRVTSPPPRATNASVDRILNFDCIGGELRYLTKWRRSGHHLCEWVRKMDMHADAKVEQWWASVSVPKPLKVGNSYDDRPPLENHELPYQPSIEEQKGDGLDTSPCWEGLVES
ncbi:hypothetical protein Q8F55_007348 [Vanrija albida]|uniref:Uncharacterized protein n=1 Tax=Vanrija albida TaxID=181172 RepID=A0ABR3PU72_9TREE